jgi:hypothetical protein
MPSSRTDRRLSSRCGGATISRPAAMRAPEADTGALTSMVSGKFGDATTGQIVSPSAASSISSTRAAGPAPATCTSPPIPSRMAADSAGPSRSTMRLICPTAAGSSSG